MDTKENSQMVVIANPIYDTVFKRLMENEHIVKFFIGTLLGRTIVSVDMKPQEFTYERKAGSPEFAPEEYRTVGFSVLRVDFIATIQTEDGSLTKVLIEVQKAWEEEDFMRFRKYLAGQYIRKDKVDGKEVILPITTIYVLGFNLPEIESACIKVEREYKDLVNGGTINVKSPFVEKLTHDSYVVQVGRITERYQTPLDKLLSIFEQAHFIGNNETIKQYQQHSDDKNLKEITDVLHYVGTDPEERKKLEIEQEAWRSFNEALHNGYEKRDRIIEDQAKALEEQAKALEDQAKSLEEQAKEIAQLKHLLAENK
jgi:hypothetical protein